MTNKDVNSIKKSKNMVFVKSEHYRKCFVKTLINPLTIVHQLTNPGTFEFFYLFIFYK